MQLPPMPAQDAPNPTETQGAPGYEICIKVGGDGMIAVSAEPDGAEDAEPMGEGGEVPGMQAASIEDALKMAKNIFDNKGQMPESQGGMSPEQAFSGGFQQGFEQG